MSDQAPTASPTGPGGRPGGPDRPPTAFDPQRLLRIAGLTREVLDEARRIKPEPGAVEHLREVHGQITGELREALPPELFKELDELTPDIREGSLEELALAHAEILGWLEGLFQGTQLAIQVQALRSAEQAAATRNPGRPPSGPQDDEPGQYL